MIDIKLFKFDAKTDYLPYYKSYSIEADTVNTLEDVLNTIYSIEKFGRIEDEEFFLQVNKQFTSSKTSLDFFLRDSSELLLEPLSIKRASNDLIIDTKDYQEKLNLLDSYMSENEKATILQNKTYMLEYYASNTLNFHDDYVGEHIVLLGLDIVKKDPSLKEEIFKLLDSEDGVINKSSLKYRIVNYPEVKNIQKDKVKDVIQTFENFNIALYCGLEQASFENIIKQSGANYIALESRHFDIPLAAKTLSRLMAGTILLEALDNNADFLIVQTKADLSLFDKQQKAIEKEMGREIALPVLTRDEFVRILEGEKNKDSLGLNAHKINVPFLD